MRHRLTHVAAAILCTFAVGACAEPPDGQERQGGAESASDLETRTSRVLERETDRIAARADSIYQELRAVPLMRPGDRNALRRYLQDSHLARARRLGVDRPDSAALAALRSDGRLVPLEDSTRHWVVRDLGSSAALVTPDVHALLVEIGERFQAQLDEMGIPPYRIVVSSALRTAEDQAALRRRNPNAARGVSTHEFGTTVDVPYDSYSAPAQPVVDLELDDDTEWLEAHLRRVEAAMLERAAMQKSREMQAILGDVLRQMQAEGMVLVTLEQQQPVYHMTVADRLAD